LEQGGYEYSERAIVGRQDGPVAELGAKDFAIALADEGGSSGLILQGGGHGLAGLPGDACHWEAQAREEQAVGGIQQPPRAPWAVTLPLGAVRRWWLLRLLPPSQVLVLLPLRLVACRLDRVAHCG